MFVQNVVIDYRDRPEGSESKLNTYSDGFKVLRTILHLFRFYRHGIFFGVIAAILAVLSLAFFPVLVTITRTGLVPKIPTLIVCGFVMVAAMQSFFASQILQHAYQKNRQDFEMEFYGVSDEWKNFLPRKNPNGSALT